MNNKKNIITFYRILVIVAFSGIIFCPSIAFNGALSGLRLWSVIVLPGLFPALIITTCILALFPMSKAVSYLYVMGAGVFCGFPIGSILCGQLHQQNPSETVCNKIMAYCNLSSPSFVMNYIIFSSIAGRYSTSRTLLCIYLPVIELFAYSLFRYRKEIFPSSSKSTDSTSEHSERRTPSGHLNTKPTVEQKEQTFHSRDMVKLFDQSIQSAITSMLKLGGYIVVFSCLSAYIYEIPFGNETITAIICGITEITNGIYLISRLPIDTRLLVLLIITINAFGGISTLMQTAGMTAGTGVSIKKYIYHKLIFAVVTLANCLLIIYVL